MIEIDSTISSRGGSVYILVPPAFVKHYNLKELSTCKVRETKDGIRVRFEK